MKEMLDLRAFGLMTTTAIDMQEKIFILMCVIYMSFSSLCHFGRALEYCVY